MNERCDNQTNNTLSRFCQLKINGLMKSFEREMAETCRLFRIFVDILSSYFKAEVKVAVLKDERRPGIRFCILRNFHQNREHFLLSVTEITKIPPPNTFLAIVW